ncbi:hypothetical protein QYF61_006138 [Mycteria americana]|uniref:Reverse transcriptase/retrotransposon-derived protein RNase H-like domain-containing protein n=1 Tax=Mycteria americana TaxID=33587 RepID=A0AAN7NKQ3_MYCAM|nr:hypothetical protein QYF61_006138 [Mycteria americana]
MDTPYILISKILHITPQEDLAVPVAVSAVFRLPHRNIVSVLSNKKFKNIIQRSAPRLDSDEWQGVCDSMGKRLGRWAPPVFWNVTPEQVQNPEKLAEYLEKVCCHPGNSRETQITATCWGLAHAYRALFNTIQYPQGEEKVSGSDDKMTGTAATPTPVTGTAAEPGNQPVPVSVTPIHKKKYWMRKSARLERDDEKAGPSQGEEEEEEEHVDEMETTWSLSLNSREAKQLGSLSREWGIDKATGKGAQALSLWRRFLSAMKETYPFKEDVIYCSSKWREERGIQYLRELAVLEVIYDDLDNTQLSQNHTVWKRPLRLSSPTINLTLPRPPLCHVPKHLIQTSFKYLQGWRLNHFPGQPVPMLDNPFSEEKFPNIQSKPPLVQLEAISSHPITCYLGEETNTHFTTTSFQTKQPLFPQLSKDPDEVRCTRPMWWKFVRTAPSSYANPLAVMTWKDRGTNAVEKLSRKVQQLEEDRSYSPPIRTSISAIRSQGSSAQERGYRGYTPQGTLWFYLHDHREDMREWDGKPTLTLEAQVHELQGKTITQGGSSRKIVAAASSGQFPRHSRRADPTSSLNKGTPDLYLQEVGNEYYDQDKRGPASSQLEERDNRVYWTVWIQWPGTSDPQEHKALVDTLHQVTQKKNHFKWGPEQQQAFEQIKREIVQAVALGPVRAGQDVKNVLYTAAGENGPTWSLWQKAPGETRGQPLGFWRRGYRGSKACYTATEKETLAAYEGV